MPPHSTWWWLGFQRVRVTKVTNPAAGPSTQNPPLLGRKTPSWHTVPSQTAKLRQPPSWSCFLHRLLYLVSRLSFSIPIPPCERNSTFSRPTALQLFRPQARPGLLTALGIEFLLTRKKKKKNRCTAAFAQLCNASRVLRARGRLLLICRGGGLTDLEF